MKYRRLVDNELIRQFYPTNVILNSLSYRSGEHEEEEYKMIFFNDYPLCSTCDGVVEAIIMSVVHKAPSWPSPTLSVHHLGRQ